MVQAKKATAQFDPDIDISVISVKTEASEQSGNVKDILEMMMGSQG